MQRYLADREALISGAVPGTDPARRLARLTDDTLIELAEAATSRPRRRWALVALGGYGAGMLLPGSDLDLLIVSDEGPAALKPFVEAVFYPLWDAGLKVGHQVRSPKDQLRACREDIATLTATLTARPLAGDFDLATAVIESVVKDVAKHRKRVLAELVARTRPGSAYLLEPDLKEGAGGRRDYDELVWLAAVLAGKRTARPAPLKQLGLLGEGELERLEVAAEITAAARWEAHRLGVKAGPLTLDVAADLATDPGALQQALADTAHTLLRVRRRLAGVPVAEAPPSPEALLELASRGVDALEEMEDLAWSGLLDGYVGGFSSLMTLRRPGLSHRYTVGAHSVRAALSIPGLCADASGALARSCGELADIPVLVAAALVHDVGKRDGGTDHARAGAEPAHDAALALGLRPSRAQDVADLVRLHLALVEVATRDDVDDEDVVLRTAARIGRRELVAPLHVLTAADSLATGPEAWGPWQQALVGTLVTRLDAALSPDVDGAGMATRAEAVRSQALTGADESLHAFIQAASMRYLASVTADQVIAHARLAASLDAAPGAGDVRVAVGTGPVEGSYTVAVAVRDRAEVFARIAGALALAGLDILSADASGTHAGVALDVFVVRSATLATPDSETWPRFERYLRAALSDRLELATRLAERRRHYPHQKRTPTRVEYDRSAGYGTLVKVTATDRVGLLHDLAHAISATGLDIRWSKVLTSDGIARDTFLVTGPDGGPVDDPGVLGHLTMRMRELG